MKRMPALAALALSAPALAANGGALGTMQLGTYVCELPGDATGPAAFRVPGDDFNVTNASSYEKNGVRGSYLLTGDTLVMTSGPMRGNRYRRYSGAFLRKIGADGQPSPLRCVRKARNTR